MSEVERLRERVETLEADLREATVDLDAAKEAHAAAQKDLDTRANALLVKRKIRRSMLLAVVLGGLPTLGVIAYTVLRYVEPERLTLEVRGVEGPAPAILGEACTLQFQPAFFPYNTLLKLSCGGQRIYGFDSFGQLTCEVSEQRVTTCLDDDDIAHGGDPRVRLDRSVGRMTVDDGANWRIELGFTE
jgi:hypothetical protein